MGDYFKFINLFLSFLKNNPWQTLITLFVISILGNGFQFFNCKVYHTSSMQKVAYDVVDSLNHAYIRQVDHLRDVQLPNQPEQFAEVLEAYYKYTTKAKEEMRRLGYDKVLNAEEKRTLIETLQVNF